MARYDFIGERHNGATTMTIFVPQHTGKFVPKQIKREGYYDTSHKFPVLMLLHDLGGDCTDWELYGDIARISEEKQIIIVCPGGETGFYLDTYDSDLWEKQIMDVIWQEIEGILPSSARREDHAIAGIGMGAFGTLRFALRYPQRFAKAAAFSGICNYPVLYAKDDFPFTVAGIEDIFGPKEAVPGSSYDLMENITRCGDPKPEFVLSCGKSEDTFDDSVKIRDALTRGGFQTWWRTADGVGNWDFWKNELRWAVDWMFPDVSEN
ncbi:MAG: hypothetical protein LUF35_00195 [Lachnospiraceae bacterium]|nr:hypothetical protein [Lachnospiraceae bacterium]